MALGSLMPSAIWRLAGSPGDRLRTRPTRPILIRLPLLLSRLTQSLAAPVSTDQITDLSAGPSVELLMAAAAFLSEIADVGSAESVK